MNATARRLPASPYARRLARERALPLEALRGSGPGGRILAADVQAFVPSAVQPLQVLAPAASPSIVPPQLAGYAASIALHPLRDLLATLERAGHSLAAEDPLLCAVGRAFPETEAHASVALELAGRQAVFADIATMSPAACRAKRLAALASTRDDTQLAAALSLKLLEQGGIRPVAMPLLPGRAMRLTIAFDSAAAHAECLLTTDIAQVDETAAAAWLDRFRTAIENPLRLFV